MTRHDRDRPQRALRFIAAYHDRHGYWPTVRELQRDEGLDSSNSANALLRKLEDAGYLYRRRNSPRAMFITETGYDALGLIHRRLNTAKHGSRSRYTEGCRCTECTAANTKYQREHRKAS